MLPSTRPMKESTISSAEISISTPRADTLEIMEVRSSCKVIARRSCMSTWMVTRRKFPTLRIGIRSMSFLAGGIHLHGLYAQAHPPQGQAEGVGERGLGDHAAQI